MGKIYEWLRVVVLCVLLLGGMAVAASDDGPPTDSRSWLGADPGYGMRGWEELYPGLDLTPEQKRQLADIRVETLRQVCAARDDLEVPAAERMRRIGEARRIGRERELAVLTPEQREHLRQNPPCRSPLLDNQNRARRGGGEMRQPRPAPRNNAGLVPGVSDLTDEQTNRIAAIRAETQRQVQAVQRDRSLTPQQRSARIEEIQRQGHDRVLEVLTADQRAAFETRWRQRPGAATGRPT